MLTDAPEQTGVDRVVNIAAAYEQMGKACVVVDAGTAITVNVCNDSGDFLGGAIASGAGVQLAALHEKTAKLPSVPLDTPQGLIGKSTEQAILHGVFYGIRGMVKELVENYATELGTWPDIIATGGDRGKVVWLAGNPSTRFLAEFLTMCRRNRAGGYTSTITLKRGEVNRIL